MADHSFKNIIYDKDDETGIVQITLNRPEIKNALSMLVLLDWYDAVEMIDQDDTVKGVVITGARHPADDDPTREAFSSGGYFDFSELEALDEETKNRIDFQDIALKKLCLKMWQLYKPMIEAVSAALDRENEVLNRLFGGADFQEALTARLQKRDPLFKGE